MPKTEKVEKVEELTAEFTSATGAVVDGTVMGEDQAKSLATLESREVSLGKVAGMLQAPLARMVFLLQAPLQRLAYALAEHARQGGVDTAAQAEETPAEEVPAEEA